MSTENADRIIYSTKRKKLSDNNIGECRDFSKSNAGNNRSEYCWATQDKNIYRILSVKKGGILNIHGTYSQ